MPTIPNPVRHKFPQRWHAAIEAASPDDSVQTALKKHFKDAPGNTNRAYARLDPSDPGVHRFTSDIHFGGTASIEQVYTGSEVVTYTAIDLKQMKVGQLLEFAQSSAMRAILEQEPKQIVRAAETEPALAADKHIEQEMERRRIGNGEIRRR